MPLTSSPISPLFSVLINEVVVTNAAGSLKADVPVGTSAFILHTHAIRPSTRPDIHNPPIQIPLPLPLPLPQQPLTTSHFSFDYAPVVVIDDHIALPLLTGLNPLRGPVARPNAARFVPLSDAYARPLRLAAFRAAHDLGLQRSALAEGTYAWVSGPTYETRGEARLLASAGATVVGMSTVPEVVAARDEGIRVLVLSLVTNMVVGVEQATRGRSVREELDAEVRNRNICSRRIYLPKRIFSPLALISQISLLVSRWNDRLPRRCRMRRFCRSEDRRQRSCGDSWNGSSFRYLLVLVFDLFLGRRLRADTIAVP